MTAEKLKMELSVILNEIIAQDNDIQKLIAHTHKDYRLSALNLCRYMLLRSYDLRKYHDALSDLGLSSLRTGEGYVFSNLDNVVTNLSLLSNTFEPPTHSGLQTIGYRKSKKLVKKHANKLFNKLRNRNFTEIMVTLPNEAADDEELIQAMVHGGMEIARINLSHGNIDIWTRMIQVLQKVQEDTGKKLKIYMDLSDPKLRTAPIAINSKKGIRDSIPISVGEHIILTKRDTKGKKSVYGKKDEQIEYAEVGVLLHQIIDDVNVGDTVLFDDGMIRAVVVDKHADQVELVIQECYKNKLGSRKGINLPNTTLNLPALTQRDKELLPFVCQHADIVGYSFVRTGEDVKYLYEQLALHGATEMGVVFKIENQESFENLPNILLEGMRRHKIGVMIARGDLAVEIGFERISEVQNQILWICEAAHIPVIWATQVLDNLAKTGIPTRAEISDAAMGAQAECVMLNKGPHIVEAIRILKNVLIRMESHSFKKKNALRALNIAKLAKKNWKL